MAITIKQAPYTFQPAYNPIVTVVSSDKTAEANFLYVCDIYITGVSSPAYIRKKLNAEPTTGFAVFDIHREIENYLSSDINYSSMAITTNANSYVKYQCKFGEEFGLSSSGTTVYTNLTNDTAKYAFNGIFDYLDFVDYSTLADLDSCAYEIGGNSSNKFLTNQPRTTYIRDNENAWLYCQTQTSGSIYYAQIVTFSNIGATQKTVYLANSFQAVTTDAGHFVKIPIGTNQLNYLTLTVTANTNGAQPLIDTSILDSASNYTRSYRVVLTDFANNQTSEQKFFYRQNNCTNHDVYRFHFLNKLGGFDSFSFIKLSRKTSTISRQSYKSNVGTLSAGGFYTFANSDKHDTVFDTNIKDTITVNSDWISEAESTWLEELITSPTVYVDDATDGLIPITITSTAHEHRKVENDKVFNLVLTFEYSYNRKRQRG